MEIGAVGNALPSTQAVTGALTGGQSAPVQGQAGGAPAPKAAEALGGPTAAGGGANVAAELQGKGLTLNTVA